MPQHVIQRGNNREACFGSEEDFVAYSKWLCEQALRYGVALHAWILMTNHVHLLVTPRSVDGVSRMMQGLGRLYVQYFNRRHRRSGTLWEGRFRSCAVEAESYLLTCQKYIESNPVRAGMVNDPAHYRWSSYHVHAMGVKSGCHSPHEVFLRLGPTAPARQEAYRGLFERQLEDPVLETIRDTTNRGLVLGSGSFLARIEDLTGRRATHRKRGPKPARPSAGAE